MEQILHIIETISDNLPRFEIYEKLNSDPALQIALLNIFTDVVEFTVRILQHLKRGTLGKSQLSIMLPTGKS